MKPSLLLLALLAVQCYTSDSTATTTTATQKEPTWGRIYLRRGLAPIQYFRDRYGGPMVQREVEFYFPKRTEDRLGCELLPPAEQQVIRSSNGSIALVVDRGECSFETKSRNAELMGAAALVVVSADESATAPVALVGKDEIEIATVMVRKSAGDMLRLISPQQQLLGRLVPIVCERKPYVCKALTADETQYVDQQPARSGVVIAQETNATLGDFLAATFGSVLPLSPLRLARGVAPMDGCEVDSSVVELLAGKVALFAANSACSSLERVSSAQLAGATIVLLEVGGQAADMQHPSVPQSWLAYNITIASAAVSSTTMRNLAELVELSADDDDDDQEIQLELHNGIADAWDQVRRLSVKTAWPTRTDRKEKLVQHMLGVLPLDTSQLLELKRNYLLVAGGSGAVWDRLLKPLATQHHDEQEQEQERGAQATVELSVAAGGV